MKMTLGSQDICDATVGTSEPALCGPWSLNSYLSLLLQISLVQGTTVLCTTCALSRYTGIHIPNAPVAKDTADVAREEKT